MLEIGPELASTLKEVIMWISLALACWAMLR